MPQMDDWLTKAATTLGVDAIDDAAQERLLEAARDVAHGVERKLTPLATYLLGVAVERRVGAGEGRASAFSAAVADLERAIDADHDA
jgi:Domain of unknown function (DUF6457)